MAVYEAEGSTLSVNSVSITQLLSLSGPAMSVGEVSTTNLASTSKTRRPSIQPDGGTVSATFQYDESIHSSLATLVSTSSTALVSCAITYPDGTQVDFDGFVSSFEISAGGEDTNLEGTIEIMVSGAVTFTFPI